MFVKSFTVKKFYMTDPLDTVDLPATDDFITRSFDMAAKSFAINHHLPSPPRAANETEAPTSLRKTPQITTPTPTDHIPKPNPGIVYPPPLPFNDDPDHLRLLHAWYWAGYYTGLVDGKKAKRSTDS